MAETKNKNEKFAVIKISGVQMKVFEGDEYEINKISGNKGDKLSITDVLLLNDGKETKLGEPLVEGAKVELEITSQLKGDKIDGLVYKAKSRYRRRYGFRPSLTRVLVKKIA